MIGKYTQKLYQPSYRTEGSQLIEQQKQATVTVNKTSIILQYLCYLQNIFTEHQSTPYSKQHFIIINGVMCKQAENLHKTLHIHHHVTKMHVSTSDTNQISVTYLNF